MTILQRGARPGGPRHTDEPRHDQRPHLARCPPAALMGRLAALQEQPGSENTKHQFLTADLPSLVAPFDQNDKEHAARVAKVILPERIEIALSNLCRLRLLQPAMALNGTPIYSHVNQTRFGRAFYECVKLESASAD